jgi:hypothetical protein
MVVAFESRVDKAGFLIMCFGYDVVLMGVRSGGFEVELVEVVQRWRLNWDLRKKVFISWNVIYVCCTETVI